MNNPAPGALPSPSEHSGQSHYNSAYLILENFVFNPTLVIGFLHRPATGEESVGITEVLYGGHLVSVEDREQHLFHFLCHHTAPTKPSTTL
jgi:hypothetical protein